MSAMAIYRQLRICPVLAMHWVAGTVEICADGTCTASQFREGRQCAAALLTAYLCLRSRRTPMPVSGKPESVEIQVIFDPSAGLIVSATLVFMWIHQLESA